MAIPDYQTLMLPLLEIAGVQNEQAVAEVYDRLATQFGLTNEERSELLPSGRQPTFENRVGWAITYMKKAGLLESSGRGRFKITQRGIETLKEKPTEINVQYLTRFPEFVAFRQAARKTTEETEQEKDEKTDTPEEVLERAYQNLRRALAADVLERLKSLPPGSFERLVVDLLLAMGYGGSRKEAGRAIGRSGDQGIDGVINEDKLGLDVVCIQAKRWEAPVGRPVVQGFQGSLAGVRAKKGVFITTSQFTDEAREYVARIDTRIVLIDGDELAQLMIDHNVGVTEAARYEVKKIDLDYFEED